MKPRFTTRGLLWSMVWAAIATVILAAWRDHYQGWIVAGAMLVIAVGAVFDRTAAALIAATVLLIPLMCFVILTGG